MTTYIPYSLSLNDLQKRSLSKAIQTHEAVTIRLSPTQLKGTNELMLTKTQINRIRKAVGKGKGVDLSLSKSQIRKSLE